MSKDVKATVTICGACGREIATHDAERCWFCGDDLCLGCWERQGHCGHPVAEAMNELARKGPVSQADLDEVRAKFLAA